jgi:hypothetical protein
VSQRRQRRLPPGVHRLGNARSAVTNLQRADAFARQVGPLALELHQAGLSLRRIGQQLAQHGFAPRQGGLGRPLSANTVKRLLARFQRLHALSQLPAARGSSIAPPTPFTPAKADRSANAKPELQEGRGPTPAPRLPVLPVAPGAGPHPHGDPLLRSEPSWW